jgi:Icc-related predicted phosphoesterase
MAERRVTRVLCAANPAGSTDAIAALLKETEDSDVQAIALLGDLAGPGNGESLRSIFKALAGSGRTAFWVPGPGDAPIATYLREAANIEIVAPYLRGVHGLAAFADAHTVFAGFGGEIDDDPKATRDEIDRLHYPRWEPEYHLKLLRELDEHQLVMMFCTPPAHKGHGVAGAEVLTELIATYRPRLVVSGGNRGTELIGRTLVVAPGSLQDGHYAIADMHARTAEMQELAAGAPAG